jgi:plasmid stabilization system protein ParE
MRVRWTTDAADDLERICDYIAESRPDAARQVAQSVVECSVSCTAPNRGHHVSGNALRLSGDVIFSRGVPMPRWARH